MQISGLFTLILSFSELVLASNAISAKPKGVQANPRVKIGSNRQPSNSDSSPSNSPPTPFQRSKPSSSAASSSRRDSAVSIGSNRLSAVGLAKGPTTDSASSPRIPLDQNDYFNKSPSLNRVGSTYRNWKDYLPLDPVPKLTRQRAGSFNGLTQNQKSQVAGKSLTYLTEEEAAAQSVAKPPVERSNSFSGFGKGSRDGPAPQFERPKAPKPDGPKPSHFQPGTDAYAADQFLGKSGARAKMLEPDGHIQGRTMLVRSPSEKNIFQFSPDKDRLSNGNFGTTFKAKNLATNQDVILKNFNTRVPGYKNEDVAAHEQGNLKKAGRAIGGVAETKQGIYGAQTAIRGVTAHDAMVKGLATKEEVSIAGERALRYLHEDHNLVHNDATPKNMMLKTDFTGRLQRTNSGNLQAEMIDFGGATALGQAVVPAENTVKGITMQRPQQEQYITNFGDGKQYNSNNHGQMDIDTMKDYVNGKKHYER